MYTSRDVQYGIIFFLRFASLYRGAQRVHPDLGQSAFGADTEPKLDCRIQESRQHPPSHVLRK